MPELDGKDQEEDITQRKRLVLVRSPLLTIATSGANFYPPFVWFADAMTTFSGVAFGLKRT